MLQAAQELLEAVLEQADAAALCQLKAVSAAWCTHARRELCNRLCRREGNDITELDVKCLNDAGRSWEVVVAGRELPHLWHGCAASASWWMCRRCSRRVWAVRP